MSGGSEIIFDDRPRDSDSDSELSRVRSEQQHYEQILLPKKVLEENHIQEEEEEEGCEFEQLNKKQVLFNRLIPMNRDFFTVFYTCRGRDQLEISKAVIF